MLKRSWLALLATVLLMLALATPASAHSTTVSDPQGDIAATEDAYLDIVSAKVTEQIGTGTLYFMTENAVTIPDAPGGFRAWNWFIHTTGSALPDYTLVVRYCPAQNARCPNGQRWESIIAIPATNTTTFDAFAFKVDGATVKAFVEPRQLGDPSTFSWVAASRSAPATPTSVPADQTARATFAR